ncbi:MAG: hypothetical protein IJZ74_07850, partial [Clostridia bacterium]|nr:hypothetical protein [Clostridia bacterium]
SPNPLPPPAALAWAACTKPIPSTSKAALPWLFCQRESRYFVACIRHISFHRLAKLTVSSPCCHNNLLYYHCSQENQVIYE